MRIDIKSYVAREKEHLKNVIAEERFSPALLIIQIGNNPASNSYIKGKLNDAKEIGVAADLIKIPQGPRALEEVLTYLNDFGNKYDGIILQEPSGFNLDERELILSEITFYQDVDGFKEVSCFRPCTPEGIMHILTDLYKGDGKVVTVVGRGELVGKPLIPMLVAEGYTVLCANSRTPDLKALTSMSDVVVSATGRRNLITRDMLKDGAFVIDAGITTDENGKLCGDCDKAIYDDPEIMITTVPGGVGLTTRLQLMKNVVTSALVY